MAYSTVTLTGTYQLPDREPASGTIEIIPSVTRIIDADGNVILAGRVKARLDDQGKFTVDLPATDDPSLNPTGFGYTVAARLRHMHLDAVSIALPASTPTVDMADVTPVDPSTFDPEATYAHQVDVTQLDGRVTDLENAPAPVTSYNDLTDKPTIPSTAADVGALPDTTTAADLGALPVAEADTQVASLVPTSSGSETSAALSATIARGRGMSRVLAKLQTGEHLKVTLLGDSGLEGITATAGNDFAAEVKATLEARFDGTVTVNNRAVSGYRAYSPLNPGEASPTKFSQALDDAADLYVIAFGHNDIRSQGVFGPAYAPGTGYPLAASLASVEHMIRRLRIDNPGADIALSNEWQYTGASSASNTILTPYNDALRRLAAAYGCAFLDLWGALADLGVTGSTPATDDTYIIPTGTGAQHLNDAGYAVWAATLTDNLTATTPASPESPRVPDLALYGAERHTHTGWVAMPAASGRSYGTDGYRLIGSWAGAATLPQTTSTVNDQIDVQFIGTEAAIRLDGGTGQGHVKIVVDGVNYNSDLDLAPIGTGQHRLPITGLAQGVHRIVVTVLSGSVTFRGVEYLPAHVRRIKHDSALITYSGTWTATGADAQYYDGGAKVSSQTVGDSFTVAFIGTGIGVHMLGYGSTIQPVKVAVDGGAAVSQDWGVANQTGNQTTWRTIVSGLPYGRHTVTVSLNSAFRQLFVGTLAVFDERRTERPTSFEGLAITGTAVTHPQPLPSVPSVAVTPDDATSTAPPFLSANTKAAVTIGGTASARHAYRAETSRIAY